MDRLALCTRNGNAVKKANNDDGHLNEGDGEVIRGEG